MSGHSVTLQWTTGANLSVTFNVYRSSVSGVFQKPPINLVPILPGIGTVFTQFIDNTVTPGTWFYAVTVILAEAESAFSSQVSVTITSASVPSAASGLTVVASN